MSHMTSSLVVGLAAVAAWAVVAPPSIDPSRASGLSAAELALQATPTPSTPQRVPFRARAFWK